MKSYKIEDSLLKTLDTNNTMKNTCPRHPLPNRIIKASVDMIPQSTN